MGDLSRYMFITSFGKVNFVSGPGGIAFLATMNLHGSERAKLRCSMGGILEGSKPNGCYWGIELLLICLSSSLSSVSSLSSLSLFLSSISSLFNR